MTKEEYLKDIISHEEWLVQHKKYVQKALDKLKPYFEVDRFIEDYKEYANKQVIECILADSYENNNYDLGELENNIARILCIPYADVVEYRTKAFWDAIKDE